MKTTLILIVLGLLAVNGYAKETPFIAYSKAAPTKNVFFANGKTADPAQSPALIQTESPFASKWIGNAIWAQKDTTLDKIVLYVSEIADGARGATISISIMEMDKNNPYGRPAQILQTDEKLIIPNDVKNDGYIVVNVTDFPMLEGRWYGFLLHFEQAAPNRRINFSQTVRADEPRAGLFYSIDEGASYEIGNTSLHFLLQSK
ncbi:MAG: hypothetical protein WC205_15385 [Opitutaceae bacterium]|jgi:hypothetical protein